MLPAEELIAHLVRQIWKVGVHEDVHDTPRVRRELSDVLATDGLAHTTACAVAAHDILGSNDPLLPGAFAGNMAHPNLDRVLPRVADRQAEEFDAVVRRDASGAVGRGLGEVVEDPRLVDDQVRELADLQGIVFGAGRADVVLWGRAAKVANGIPPRRYAGGDRTPKVWTLRAPRYRRPGRHRSPARGGRSMMRVETPGNCDICAARSFPAGPEPTMSTSVSSGRSIGRSMPVPAASCTRGFPETYPW